MNSHKVVSHDIVNTNRYAREVDSSISYRALGIQLIKTTIMFVNALLLARFLLSAFGISQSNLIARNIFSWSEPFVRNFFELMNKPMTYGGQVVIEISTIAAIASYSLIAYLIMKVINVSTETERQSNENTH